MNTRFFRVFCLLAFLLILLAAVGCRQGVEIGELQTKSETVELGDAGSVQVEIDLAAGGLTVSGGAAELLEADFTYNVAEMEPEVAFSGDELTVTHPEVGLVGTLSERDDYRNEWDLSFNDNVPMAMLVNLGAGRGDLKLGSLALSNLGIKAGAGDVTVDLTGAPSLTQLDFEMGAGALLMDLTGDWADDLNAAITAGVGEMTLRLPGNVGVSVDVKEGIGKVSASNLAKDGDTYTNDAFGESEVTLSFDIEAGIGAINLEAEPASVAAEPTPTEEAPTGEEEAGTEPQSEQQVGQHLLTPELLAEFEAYVEQSRESLNVPGVAVAIVQRGEIVYAEGFGVKEIGGDDPVTADTVFSIGSTGKAMTSMMAASLVDDGLIAWDTPLVEVMPQFQLSDEAATRQITLREAFAHTSGLPNTDLVLFFSERPEEYLEYLANVPLAAPPGEVYAYQNEMYSLGGYAAAMAAGAEYGENLFPTYVDLMQERVFDPLGMTSATFSAEEAAAGPNHALPHFMGLNATLAETGLDVTPTHYWDVDALAPAGAVRMNAPDVGRFLITMLSGGVAPDGTRIISAENLAETWTEQIAREPDPYMEQWGSALGWSTITYQGIPIISKDGNLGGFAGQMAFIPEADTGIVVLANADVFGNSLGRNVQYKLIEMLFGLEPLIDQVSAAELEGISGASEAVSQLAAVDPETVAPFLGSYDMEGTPYTVELRDDRLWVSVGDWDFIELLAAPDGSYVAISGGSDFLFAPFQFVEAEDGSTTMIIFEQLELPKID